MSTRIELHVAAMPFPTFQGTQAAIDAICEASVAAGHATHLLSYAASEYEGTSGYTHHRAKAIVPLRSLRSGPSVPKLLLDAGLGLALRKQVHALQPSIIVAHHVEAAVAALGQHPLLFFAHTDLGAELPSYLPAALGPLARSGGTSLDRALVRRADAVAAVSPLLAERIRALRLDGAVHYVPTPWPVPDAISEAERVRARHAVGIAPDERVLLYAGNLDHYQGLEHLIAALAKLAVNHPGIRLVVGTQNDAKVLVASARAAGVAERVALRRIDGEGARQRLHAAADVAVVPRVLAAGLPIKLIDALARGVATAAMPAATGGLALDRVASIAQDDTAEALAAAIELLLDDDERRSELAAAGRRHVAYEHSHARYLEAMDAAVGAARAHVATASGATDAGDAGAT